MTANPVGIVPVGPYPPVVTIRPHPRIAYDPKAATAIDRARLDVGQRAPMILAE